MHNKYFDKYVFKKILKVSYIDPFEAKNEFEEYLEKYPTDYGAYPYYASNLIKIGKYDDADKILKYAQKLISADTNIPKNSDKLERIQRNIVFSKIKLLLYQEKYDECYYCYLQDKKLVKDLQIGDAIVFYCQKKLGFKLKTNKKHSSYIFKQINNYNENTFKEHIKKHMSDYVMNMNEPSNGIFCSSFPINEVIEEIKKYIPSNKKICSGFYDDEYTFKYNMNGRSKYKITDYFKVVCFHNTSDFITMTPALDCDTLLYVDLNYLVKNEEYKVKKLSQIDKFYQKYKNYK